MSARPSDKTLRLLHILKEDARVPPEVAEWIVRNEAGPLCESPADFAQLWTTDTVANGPGVDVLDRWSPPIDTSTFAGRKLAGRLKTAWDYCCQDLAGEAKLLAAPPKPEDETETQLWPDVRRQSCEETVFKLYRLKLAP